MEEDHTNLSSAYQTDEKQENYEQMTFTSQWYVLLYCIVAYFNCRTVPFDSSITWLWSSAAVLQWAGGSVMMNITWLGFAGDRMIPCYWRPFLGWMYAEFDVSDCVQELDFTDGDAAVSAADNSTQGWNAVRRACCVNLLCWLTVMLYMHQSERHFTGFHFSWQCR